jgi:hypothetical protein
MRFLPHAEHHGDSTPHLAACVTLFAAGALFSLWFASFPSQYDELQHLSFIAALRDAPTLFPHYGSYRVLTENLRAWSDARNYIAHPPLYYLLLAPFGDNAALLRAMNLAMATAGFALCAQAGMRLLATAPQRWAYLLLLLAFSKPALIAGMINNDNLVLLQTGVLFRLLASERSRPLAVAAVLAAVGWTKFNAFVGLVFWVGLLHAFLIARGRKRLFCRASFVLSAGVLCGAIPALANLATLGSFTYIPVDFLYVEPAARPAYDFSAFTAAFFHKIGLKVLFMDGLADMLPALITIAAIASFARFASRASPLARDIAVSAWLAMLAFAVLHLAYGWNSFSSLGTMSDAQSRYYVMLWPGFALAAVLGGMALAERIRGLKAQSA